MFDPIYFKDYEDEYNLSMEVRRGIDHVRFVCFSNGSQCMVDLSEGDVDVLIKKLQDMRMNCNNEC